MSLTPPCPTCGSKRTRTARYYSSDNTLRRLFYRPHRCRDCRHRFWLLSKTRPVIAGLLTASVVGFFVWATLPDRHQVSTGPLASFSSLKKQAEDGDASSQLLLAKRYLQGDGVQQNQNEAVRWMEKAARQGQPEAQYLYGQALLQGRGVVQDYRSAFRWIEEPARRGNVQAQVTLADMYRFGSGIPTDLPRAYLWYNLAAAQGDEQATRSRDNVATRLSPGQINEMQLEARRILGMPLPAIETAATGTEAQGDTPPQAASSPSKP